MLSCKALRYSNLAGPAIPCAIGRIHASSDLGIRRVRGGRILGLLHFSRAFGGTHGTPSLASR